VCTGWEALVLNNYEAVMPLTCKKKYLISYLFQPFFTQQLGVFSNNADDSNLVNSFLLSIPEKYRYADIQLNTENTTDLEFFEKHTRINYVLSLDKSYKEHYGLFSRNCRRNIVKAKSYDNKIRFDTGSFLFTKFISDNLEKLFRYCFSMS